MATMTHVPSELALRAHHESISLKTNRCFDFIDITEEVKSRVSRSGVRDGVVNVQTRHTTAAVIVGEHEPLLMEDLKALLEALAPCGSDYRHDDFTGRTVNMCPDEEKTGHSHCKALFLRCSETLNVDDRQVNLGTWQRIFFIELDRARSRTISVMVVGTET